MTDTPILPGRSGPHDFRFGDRIRRVVGDFDWSPRGHETTVTDVEATQVRYVAKPSGHGNTTGADTFRCFELIEDAQGNRPTKPLTFTSPVEPAPVDVGKIQPGDFVTVRMCVIRAAHNDYRGLPYVVCKDPYLDSSNSKEVVAVLSEVVSHEPAPPKQLEVGERVVFVGIHGERNLMGYVIAISEARAWVNWDRVFAHDVVPLTSLERVQP